MLKINKLGLKCGNNCNKYLLKNRIPIFRSNTLHFISALNILFSIEFQFLINNIDKI